MLPSVAQQSD